MRGKAERQGTMLSIIPPERLVPKNHPIRHIKLIVDRVLKALSPTFARMYAEISRPTFRPELLLKGSLLIALFSVRSRVPAEGGCSSVSGSSMTSCSNGSWTSTSSTPPSMRQPSPTTKSGCFGTRWPGSSSTRCSRKPDGPARSGTVAGPLHG